MDDYKIITAWVNDGNTLFGKTKATSHVIECCNDGTCELKKKNQCIMCDVFGVRCPYGKRTKEVGFTSKARKYSTWINDRKKKYAEFKNHINGTGKMMAEVGDYIYLPYAYMERNKDVVFEESDTTSCLINKQFFTPNTIKSIIEYKPCAMMGGFIKDYADKEMPLFLQHLKESYSDLYNDVKEISSRVDDLMSNYSCVGRTALLSSLNKNIILTFNAKGTYKWSWDGDVLKKVKSTVMCCPVKDKHIKDMGVSIAPTKDATVTVYDESWVNENTVFIQ